jgi:hypothetical protein
MRLRAVFLSALLLAFAAPPSAAEHPSLAEARRLYNEMKYEAAINAASMAQSDPASADAASLVMGRSHLERHRLLANDMELTAARMALSAVRPAALSPRDRVDFLIGLGQALYQGESFGAAAELFDTALSQPVVLPDHDRLQLLDWWATAVDREAQALPPDRRMEALAQIGDRMAIEVRIDPGSAPANYWLAAAARGSGDLERAWHAAIARTGTPTARMARPTAPGAAPACPPTANRSRSRRRAPAACRAGGRTGGRRSSRACTGAPPPRARTAPAPAERTPRSRPGRR